jgi:hypothetical protein
VFQPVSAFLRVSYKSIITNAIYPPLLSRIVSNESRVKRIAWLEDLEGPRRYASSVVFGRVMSPRHASPWVSFVSLFVFFCSFLMYPLIRLRLALLVNLSILAYLRGFSMFTSCFPFYFTTQSSSNSAFFNSVVNSGHSGLAPLGPSSTQSCYVLFYLISYTPFSVEILFLTAHPPFESFHFSSFFRITPQS